MNPSHYDVLLSRIGQLLVGKNEHDTDLVFDTAAKVLMVIDPALSFEDFRTHVEVERDERARLEETT